jgi:MFS family permease
MDRTIDTRNDPRSQYEKLANPVNGPHSFNTNETHGQKSLKSNNSKTQPLDYIEDQLVDEFGNSTLKYDTNGPNDHKLNGDSIFIEDDDGGDDDEPFFLETLCVNLCRAHRKVSKSIEEKHFHVLVYVFIFGLCNILVYANKSTVATSLPYIKETFNVGHAAFSVMLFLNCFSSILGSFATSHFAKPEQHVTYMTLSQAICALAALGIACSTNMSEFIMAQVTFSFAEGCFVTIMTPYIKYITEQTRDYGHSSIVYGCIAAGVSVGYFCGGWVSAYLSWRFIFLAYSVCFLLLSFVLTFVPRKREYIGYETWLCSKRQNEDEPVQLEDFIKRQNGINGSVDDAITLGMTNISKKTSVATRYIRFKKDLIPLGKNKAFLFLLFGEIFRTASVHSIGFWMPIYIYTIYKVSMTEISLFLTIACGIVGTLGTVIIGQIFEFHLKKLSKIKVPADFQQNYNTQRPSKSQPSYINIDTDFVDNLWCKYLKCCLAYEYVIVFIIVALLSTTILLFTHSYQMFCITAVVQIFCVFCILTPLNNLFVDTVSFEQKEMSVSLQFSTARIFSDMLVTPIVGISKDYVSYLAFVIIVVILLLVSVTNFCTSLKMYSTRNGTRFTWFY